MLLLNYFILLTFIQPINTAHEITKEKHQVDLKESLFASKFIEWEQKQEIRNVGSKTENQNGVLLSAS